MRYLAPLAIIFSFLTRLRALLFSVGFKRSHHLPGFVISVGNLEVGGTGKSPVVMALCEALLARGFRPAILTRGYRSGLKAEDSAVYLGSSLLMPPQQNTSFHADEARMQAARLTNVPVIVGARRFLAAQRYLTSHPAPTHWILDDGFQHLQIHRDLDLVLLDAQRPFDNGWCIPAGRLREPRSALKRAHHILLTRSPSDPSWRAPKSLDSIPLPKHKLIFEDGPLLQVAGPPLVPGVSAREGALVLGIARPERVQAHLKSQGFNVLESLLVGDHQEIPEPALHQLAQRCPVLVTTEKDFWRSPEVFRSLNLPIFVIPLRLHWASATSLLEIFMPFTSQ